MDTSSIGQNPNEPSTCASNILRVAPRAQYACGGVGAERPSRHEPGQHEPARAHPDHRRGLLAAPVLAACGASSQGAAERLTLPVPVRDARLEPGCHTLGTGGERNGVVSVPPAAGPLPLIVMLHGAGGTGRRAARLLAPAASEAGCIVLAPDSRGATWDAITGPFGADVAFVSRALAQILASCEVDPARVALAGFSDGATYALALGRANGDRFSRVLAFSPGFLIPTRPTGSPGIFVSHGVADEVLPIDRCSRKLVPALRRQGYQVRYREFAGHHEVPPAIAREGLAWMLERRTNFEPA